MAKKLNFMENTHNEIDMISLKNKIKHQFDKEKIMKLVFVQSKKKKKKKETFLFCYCCCSN